MPRVSAVYADNPVLTAAQRKRMVKAPPKGLKLRLSYAVLNVFQRYWWGQNDPLYAVLSRRGNSVQFVDVVASEEEVGRLQSVAEQIIEAPDTTGAEKRTAQSLLRQIPEDNPMKGKRKGKKSEARCGCGKTDAGQTICGCVVPNPVSRAYWTAAPKSYDYGYTVDMGRKAKSVTGAIWRLVTTTDEVRFQSHQIPRYQSGLNGIVVANSTDAKKLGLPDVKNNPVGPARRMTRSQIEKLVWGKTPRDYRGLVKGKRYILVLTKHGTSLVPISSISIDQLRDLAGIKDNPACKYQENPTKIGIRSITVEAPWMRRTVRGSKKVWANADSAARAVCKSKPSTAAKNAKISVTYRYTNGEQVQWKLDAKCSREKLATRVKKTLIPAAGFDWPSRGRKPSGAARQSMLDLLAYYDTGPAIRAPWDK